MSTLPKTNDPGNARLPEPEWLDAASAWLRDLLTEVQAGRASLSSRHEAELTALEWHRPPTAWERQEEIPGLDQVGSEWAE